MNIVNMDIFEVAPSEKTFGWKKTFGWYIFESTAEARAQNIPGASVFRRSSTSLVSINGRYHVIGDMVSSEMTEDRVKIREAALAKLTEKEREVLGV